MLRPNLDMLRAIFGLPGQNQNGNLHKTDCCKSVAPSSGEFRWRPAPRYVCERENTDFIMEENMQILKSHLWPEKLANIGLKYTKRCSIAHFGGVCFLRRVDLVNIFRKKIEI